MSENATSVEAADHDAEEREVPVLVRWRGCELRPDGYGSFASGSIRVGADGWVHQLKEGRVDVTTAPRFATGMHDGWVVDTLSGYVVAWRGINRLNVSNGHRTEVLALDEYRVIFAHDQQRVGKPAYDWGLDARVPFRPNDWLATMGPLQHGEVMLDARRPKSLVRRVRRARQAGGREIPGTSLLLFERREVAEWPPPARVRTPRARAGEGKNHPANKRR